MSLIIQWVMQIVVFILIATIIELIIPDNAMKKYVNLVVGLILILIFAQPLLHLFKIDMSSKLVEVESTLFEEGDTFNQTESLLENQKKDIQAEQDAYILSKVKEQLIDEASPALLEQHNVTIHDIEFQFQNETIDKYEDLEEVIVYLQLNKSKTKSTIDPIVIEFDQQDDGQPDLRELTKQVHTLLQDSWDLHDKKIAIKWEGGAS